MTENIHPSLESLAVDISTLVPLDGNPRRGSVEAIASSYSEFVQIKPIVVRPNGDGTSTVIAGNHQLEAAKRLGWEKIAVIEYDVDDKRALAYALADNRTMELGQTDFDLLQDLILEVSDVYPELLEDLGWDEFDLAEKEQHAIRDENQIIGSSGSYVPPVISSPTAAANNAGSTENDPGGDSGGLERGDDYSSSTISSPSLSVTKDRDGSRHIKLIGDREEQSDAAIRGSTAAIPGSAPRAMVQYTIVFDNTDQQATWYEFVKLLRGDSNYEGKTFAEKLILFVSEYIR
jgi:hypothetical protein